MAFFDDFESAVLAYPADKVTLSIVSDEVVIGTTPVVNVNEVWRFKVRVSNSGHLNLTGVSLHILGTNSAHVGINSGGPFLTSIFSSAFDVAAHTTKDVGYFYFKAPTSSTAAAVALVSARIYTWDANLTDLLNTHNGYSSTPVGSYTKQVFP